MKRSWNISLLAVFFCQFWACSGTVGDLDDLEEPVQVPDGSLGERDEIADISDASLDGFDEVVHDEACSPHHHSACMNGDRYWFNSCGQQEELLEDCPFDCSNDHCTTCPTQCQERVCGSDGCEGTCQPGCTLPRICNETSGQCDCPNTTCGASCCAQGQECKQSDLAKCCSKDTGWTDASSCDCTPSACSSCDGHLTQKDDCEYSRQVACSEPTSGCTTICCAGSCCAADQVCHEVCCTPNCQGRTCGDDGCGGACPPGCTGNETCDNGVCCAIQDSVLVNSRFGIGLATQGDNRLDQFDYPYLHIGWYADWASGQLEGPKPGVPYVPLIGAYGQTIPSEQYIRNLIASYPSNFPSNTLWSLGNEVGMDDGRAPSEYAVAYHDIYHALKNINPNFRVSNGAVLPGSRTHMDANHQPGSLTGLEYLSQAAAAYQSLYGAAMPFDEYCIHGYTSADWDNVDLFKQAILDFRAWMKGHGDQNKPLFIKEFSPLGNDVSVMPAYMTATVTWLVTATDQNVGMPGDSYHLVQRWAWFVMNDGEEQFEGAWDNLNLYDSDSKARKALADVYAGLAAQFMPRMYIMNSQGAALAVGQSISSGFVPGDNIRVTGLGATLKTPSYLAINYNYVLGGVQYSDVAHSNAIGQTTDWTTLQLDFTLPAGTTRFDAAFLLGGAGTAGVRQMSIINLRTGQDLAVNGDFAQGSGSMPPPWWLYQSSAQFTKAQVIGDPNIPVQ